MHDPSYGHHSSHQLCYNIFGHIDSYVPMDDSHMQLQHFTRLCVADYFAICWDVFRHQMLHTIT